MNWNTNIIRNFNAINISTSGSILHVVNIAIVIRYYFTEENAQWKCRQLEKNAVRYDKSSSVSIMSRFVQNSS